MLKEKIIAFAFLGLIITGCRTAKPSVAPVLPTDTTQPTITIRETARPTGTATLMQSLDPSNTPIPPSSTSFPPTATIIPSATSLPIPATLISISDPTIALRLYGGDLNDWAYDVLLLDDGGTLIAGQIDNTGPSHRITPGKAHLIRTDAQGDIIWEKSYGGEADSLFYSLIQVGEQEYLVLGQIAASYERQEDDFYLVKVDGEGNEIWSHTYGGRGMDIARMVRQTTDGGYILVGDRADEHPTGDMYQSNLILIKTDADGNEIWSHTYGERKLYLGWGVEQTPDGGYVVVGWEAKTISDRDVIAIKTDAMGEETWTRTWDLDPKDRDGGFDLILTPDGHIVIACIQSMDSGTRVAVAIKVDLEGNEIWLKAFREEGVGNEFWDVMQDFDGGYVLDGVTTQGKNPNTGDDSYRGLIVKTDVDGKLVWKYSIGGDEYKRVHFSSGVVLTDGEYLLVGAAIRSGGEYTDMLWLKLNVND